MATKSSQIQIRVTPAQKAALKRLSEGASQDLTTYVLSRALPSARLHFQGIVDGLRSGVDRGFAFAELNDFLAALTPLELPSAVAEADVAGLGALEGNYLAGMVEQASRLKGVEPPGWVHEVEPLSEPYFPTSLRSLRGYLLRTSPVAFKRRNIFIDASVGDRV